MPARRSRRRRPARAESTTLPGPIAHRPRPPRAGLPWGSGRRSVGGDDLGDFNACRRALVGPALKLELVRRAVNDAEPFVDVAQADAAFGFFLHAGVRQSDAVVADFEDQQSA